MIKGAFFAVTEVFADFYNKISKFCNTPKWSFFSVNHPLSRSYLDLSAANSPSIQNQNAISLKRKVFSGFSANGLTSKAKNDGGVVDALTENSNSVRECDGIFKRRVQKEYTSAKIPSRHRLGEFSLGRSMIEMLGVLAIIGVLSVGGIAGYSKAMNKFKTNKVADNVSMLVANIKTAYAQQNTYTGLNNANAVSIGVVPDELVVKDANGAYSTLLNAFNGSVYISQSDSTNSGDGKAFIIEFGSLSKEACIALATNDWGSGYSSGLIAMLIEGTPTANAIDILDMTYIGKRPILATSVAMAIPGATRKFVRNFAGRAVGVTPVPMPAADAAAACSCNTGNTCSISWKYY